MRILVSRL